MLESDKSVGEVINIGSNYEVSIGQTVEYIAEVMQVQIEIEEETVRLRPDKSEVERLWADNSKAKKLLNWEPQYGGVEGFKKGLSKTVEWFIDSDQRMLYKAGMYNI
ncbi:dTDP-glucose 4,6 dehydratase [compost metagenome]